MRKNQSSGRDRPKARQQEFVGFQFLRARQRLATSDAMPASVDELEPLLRPPFGDSHDPRAMLDETAVGARPDTDKGFDSPTPSRKRLGISLLLIPIFLVVLFLPTSIDQSTDNAGTASQNRTVSYTAVQVPPQTEIQAEPNALEQLGAPEPERGTADEFAQLATARRELEKAGLRRWPPKLSPSSSVNSPRWSARKMLPYEKTLTRCVRISMRSRVRARVRKTCSVNWWWPTTPALLTCSASIQTSAGSVR